MRSGRWLLPAAATAACAAVAGGVLLDARIGMFQGAAGRVLPLCALAVMVLLATAWRVRGRPRALAVLAGAAAAVSLAGTAHVVLGPSGREPVGFAEPAALLAVLALVAWRGSGPGTAAAVPALIGAIVVRPLSAGPGEAEAVVALFLALATLAAVAGGLTARLVALDRRRRETTVRLEQRAEFARDLHDFVAHHVTGIVVQAQGARVVAAGRPELVEPALADIERAGAQALTAMRRMVGTLREPDGGPPPGTQALRDLVARFRLPNGAAAVLHEHGDCDDLPVEVAGTLYRVVLEALTNVRRHAPDCSGVEVELARSDGAAAVRVHDDGRRRPRASAGFGLKGLAERVAMVGGTLTARPAATGWVVQARVPLREAA